MKPTGQVGIAIDNESRTSADLLRLGLGALQATGPSNDSYHLHLTLLSSGIERLTKLLLILDATARGARVPDVRRFKHDVRALVDTVCRECFDAPYLQRPIAVVDLAFLAQDALFQELLGLLNDFGGSERYHHLDISHKGPNPDPSPEDRWRKIRDSTVPTPQVLLTPAEAASLHAEQNRALITSIERGIRAMSRLLTLGTLSEAGKPWSAPFMHFIQLRDGQLGAADYTSDPFVPTALWRARQRAR